MDLNSSYQHQLQQNQPNSRLLRFRSATSSDHIRSNFKQGGEGCGGSASTATNNNETAERLVLRFNNSGEASSSSFRQFMDRNPSNHSSSSASSSMMVGSSMRMDQTNRTTSPAGHFSNNNIISFANGYDTMKGVENYDGVNDSDGELTLSMNILKNQIGFSPKSHSSLGRLSHNSKTRSDGIGTTRHDDGRQDGNDDTQYYGHKFLYDSNDQNIEAGNQVNTLSHHLSLPRKSSEMFVVENLLQFPDSVPSSIRAKRGFATHPRSVAERVRRTRISERMRKLQELVPNIDKQTCTSDMLELAVDYINDLQKQLKIMTAKRAKCRCRNQK
ncbi:transcription factor bHLH130-like protein [Trifolium pratense]|uniref:Uncharacterized protein n=2 Tax=Trifolium pratense TaxID=57577 RepID=A0ACB0LPA7_TRIPR|nr:transcription factor bHLH130-like protein [Trifolium pratense]CAJ2671385.1 unnamed protein product [Trifolium pratense]